jgi:GTP cyclohydrolase I
MINITQEQLEKDSLELAKKIKKFGTKFGYVIGISRGGIIPAQIIAKELEIPFKSSEEIKFFDFSKMPISYPGARLLIVDDLIDSGKTLKELAFNLSSFTVRTAVLYKKKNKNQAICPNYFLKEVPNQWVCLPHEEGYGVEDHITRILEFVGEDPTREGLKDTPRRVAKMYTEIFRGYDPTQKPKITTFLNGKDGITYSQMIIDEGTFYSHCLTGDTQIKTVRGIFRIKDLVGRTEDVFCYDEKNKRFTIAKAKDIRMTSKKAEILKLTTDYGAIYATSEHKFLTYNRGWVMLKDLKPKDSLVALNSRLSGSYLTTQVSDSRDGWRKEHNFIYEEMSGEKLKSKELVHHIDGDKRNNIYENLQKMINKDHTGLHARKYMASLSSEQKSEIGKKANWGFISLREKEPEKYKLVKEKARNSLKKMYSSERGIALKEKKSRDTKIWWKNRKEKKMKNHRVVKVEFSGFEPVYNMEVEKYHNFVANSLVVHNCEHHMVPFFGKYYFAYIPNKTIIGLSKVARIVDYYSARLQVQERLVRQIVDEIEKSCKPRGIALVMKAEHLCKTMRGVKKQGVMTASELRGSFVKDSKVRQEFLSLIKI